MRVTGVDAGRGGWVAVSLDTGVSPDAAAPLDTGVSPDGAAPPDTGVSLDTGVPPDAAASLDGAGTAVTVRTGPSLDALLAPVRDRPDGMMAGIDMPLGLLEAGWREADRAARGLLGPRRSSVFAIPPRAVWAEASYPAANRRCRELTGQGFSVQAWGLRAKLLEANVYWETCEHPLYEVHPELAFGAMAGAPLTASKHTGPGRDLRRGLLSRAGIQIPAGIPAGLIGDVLDAAAVAWSARRIAAGLAVTIPGEPQRDGADREIAIRF